MKKKPEEIQPLFSLKSYKASVRDMWNQAAAIIITGLLSPLSLFLTTDFLFSLEDFCGPLITFHVTNKK